MPVLYLIGGIIALGLLGYLVWRFSNRSCSDDIQWDFSNCCCISSSCSLAKPLGRYMARVYEEANRLARAGLWPWND
jgi:hypothetical protein